MAKFGAVSTGHPACTQAAMDILQAGGNAYDAAIAAGYCSAIAEPLLSSLGGGGYLLAKTQSGRHTVLDFFVNVPGVGGNGRAPRLTPIDVPFSGATQRFHLGPGSVTVPGVILGFFEAHRRLGKLPLSEVVAPAISLASQGVVVNATQAYVLKILHPIMCQCDEGNRLYTKDGRLLKEGETFFNRDYASFLRGMNEESIRELYRGSIARNICEAISEDSPMTFEDWTSYAVLEREPHVGHYRNYKLLTNPSLGGHLIFEMLNHLEKTDFSNIKHGSIEHLRLVTRAFQEVEAIKRPAAVTRGTTHISVSDNVHNFASLSISNGEGSGFFIPNTGIMINNMLGEDDLYQDFSKLKPGERMDSMMAPCLLEMDDTHSILIGSGGSKRIRSSITQVINNLVDFGMSLSDAVDYPRLNWDGTCLQMEPGFEESVVKTLSEETKVNVWPCTDFYFGGTHSVVPNREAHGDPRRGGSGEVL